jgi:hypothetical protein
MSWFQQAITALFNGDIFGGIRGIIDESFTSEEEKLEAHRKLVELEEAAKAMQVNVNLQEAKHKSVFVAGWRPFIGWVGGVALAYNFIIRDVFAWVLSVWWPLTEAPPVLDASQLFMVILGMLGIGGMRSFDKLKKTNTERIK